MALATTSYARGLLNFYPQINGQFTPPGLKKVGFLSTSVDKALEGDIRSNYEIRESAK